MVQMREGMAAMQAMGSQVERTVRLAQLARAHGALEQAEEGLTLLAEALAEVHQRGERCYEAELYRLQGELTLKQASGQGRAASGQEEAEACFRRAIAIARRQSAKAWELRATVSLAAVAAAGQHGRSSATAGRDLWLVH